MTIRFLSVAAQEYRDAFDYYEAMVRGLGAQFSNEVINTIDRINRFPQAWQKLSPRSRRCRTDRFPYGLIYQIKADEIIIIAVMHLDRDPTYWVRRLE